MSEAFEVSADDPAGVAAAFERAAHGSRVRVVRHGRVMADIVPAEATAALDEPAGTRRDGRHEQVVGDHASRFGAPTLAHYRHVYSTTGRDWPGDAYIRAHYPVADAS